VTCPNPPLPRTLSLTQFSTSRGSSVAIVEVLKARKVNHIITKRALNTCIMSSMIYWVITPHSSEAA
jgi:hypothetical protein